ncbi:type II toxin-antitoxin system RelE/ParE family toxin [Geitlerinema sp. P-1104]|uniref:type II toxin-antitoxin system RelE/ParE family toxin n=1 Tax=Geitlerinema sp. P-1104 TaxID=2546230 RepID=UPI00147731C3|nr:type II toxin-antitoxin system RelE/ParE family toxin [Geitlerinema sp. P-1104]NMG56935.1 type II toxin-antitoxin system RelE/ParE family toxin [Geitlerinema sp. P-1104]
MSTNSPVQVLVSDRFIREIRQLAKRYRGIRLDVQPIIDQLEAGELPGDQIPGIDYTLFKVRVQNRDARRGKRGGYRIIYYLKTERQRLLVTIYSKSDKSDISTAQVCEIITRSELDFNRSNNIKNQDE